MHRNFFLFEKQVQNLALLIEGSQILEAFTYRKNELIIILDDPAGYLHISLDIQYPYLLFGEVFKIRKPKYQFFDILREQKIQKMKIAPFDKRVELLCDDHRLDMIFFGRTPNLNLYDCDGNLLESFKERADIPAPDNFPRLDFRQTSKKMINQALQDTTTKTLFEFLNRHFYALNKIIIREMAFRAGLDAELPVKELDTPAIDNLVSTFVDIKTQMDLKETYLISDTQRSKSHLSLFPLKHLGTNTAIQTDSFSDLNRAWWKFISVSRDQEQRNRLYKTCRNGIDKRTRFIQNALDKLAKEEDINQRKQLAELKGNLLLTFKNQIRSGSSKARLTNIFSDYTEEIIIKLNPAKSVVENANNYFNKYKNVAEKQEIVRIKKDTLISELNQIQDLSKQLDSAKFPALLKLEKQLSQRNILQKPGNEDAAKQSLEYSFKRYVLEKEWNVYVGKNGPNNALLTFNFAHRWDIWLHAQGVPGSHVVIQLPGRDNAVPRKVIEQAAQLAAANSKARFSATVPVIFTEVRFVNRVRKALPGTVTTRNEQVIFVKPLIMN